MISRAHHLSNTITYSTLIPKPKPTSLINSLTLFLHLRNPYQSLALPKCGCKTGGLPSDTIPDRQQDSNTNMPEIDISLNGLLKLLHNHKIVSKYDQEKPQSQTADNPVAPRGRAAQPSRDTRKTN